MALCLLSIIRKVIHPDYNTPTILNADIGLLKLKDRISSFTKFVNPLCLPAIGQTGFGTSAYGPGNHSILDTAGLDIVSSLSVLLKCYYYCTSFLYFCDKLFNNNVYSSYSLKPAHRTSLVLIRDQHPMRNPTSSHF